MTQSCAAVEPLLSAAQRGDFDPLTPAQVAALEAHLEICPRCARRLASATPEPDPRLRSEVALPDEGQWQRLWQRMAAAWPAGRGGSEGLLRRFRRPLVAAAAGLLLAAAWRLGPPWRTPGWELEPSDHVVVHEVETYGDVTALVVRFGGRRQRAMVWFLEQAAR